MQKTPIDFAIITIREDEFEAIARRFQLTPQRGSSGRNYGISVIQTRDGKKRTVAVARCAEPGPQPAQQLAHDMISDLSPFLLLVVGIAGATPDTDFTLGDVIISSRIHDFGVNAHKPREISWDMRGGIHSQVSEIVASLPMYNTWLEGWNTPESIQVSRPNLDVTKFKAFDTEQMTHKDKQNIFDGAVPESWQKKILSSLKWHFGNPPQRLDQPLYKTGSIASSGSLIRDTSIVIQWLKNARSIRAIEMEAGGVFQAAQQIRGQDYPVMAIRGISDIVGFERDYHWTPYACHSAAAFTYALLTTNSSIFDNLQHPNLITGVPKQPLLGNTPSLSSSISSTDDIQVDAPPIGAQENGKGAVVQIYISYAEKDEGLKDELEMHLSLLRRLGVINTWHSRQIGLGKKKDKEVDSHIDTAQIILLLVSPRFMASNYCYEQEMMRAMQRQASGGVCIIPILLRSVDWQKAPFGILQGLPRNNKPIASWQDRDQAWSEITQEIRRLCDELRGA